MRAAGVPMAVSGGYSPRARISFGLALPTGAESVAEYVDVLVHPDEADGQMRDAIEGAGHAPGDLLDRLAGALPEGIVPLHAERCPRAASSLQEAVQSCTWALMIGNTTSSGHRELADRIASSPAIMVNEQRHGKASEEDVKSRILYVDAGPVPLEPVVRWSGTRGEGIPGEVAGPACGASPSPAAWQVGEQVADTVLVIEVSVRPRGLRLDELAAGLGRLCGSEVTLARARRIHQWIDGAQGKQELLPLGESQGRALERAS